MFNIFQKRCSYVFNTKTKSRSSVNGVTLSLDAKNAQDAPHLRTESAVNGVII